MCAYHPCDRDVLLVGNVARIFKELVLYSCVSAYINCTLVKICITYILMFN